MRAVLIVLALAFAVCAEVTPEDIKKQETVVIEAEDKLAALEGELTAQNCQVLIDSTLAANGVRILPYLKDLGGMWTDVDVPYTRWDEITQLKWDIHVEGWERTYKLKPTGTVGRYSVRKDKDRLLKFLKEVEQFVTQGDD